MSLHTLPALQARGLPDVNDRLEPVSEDDPQNFDLVDPPDAPGEPMSYSLEQRSRDIFSAEHLQHIFKEPKLLLKFTMFLHEHRPDAVPNLLYYLDVTKALKALGYANSITRALLPLDGLEYTSPRAEDIRCDALERTARAAFQRMVDHDLPALVTWTWTETVSASISKRITGTLPVHLREASEGLAEVFCLTDPSREDNPIVFASEGALPWGDSNIPEPRLTHARRIPPDHPIRHEPRHRAQLPLSARPRDQPAFRPALPRGRQGGQGDGGGISELVGRVIPGSGGGPSNACLAVAATGLPL